MQKLFKSLNFWVLVAAILGYLTSYLFGNKTWLDPLNTSMIYEVIVDMLQQIV